MRTVYAEAGLPSDDEAVARRFLRQWAMDNPATPFLLPKEDTP